MNETISSFLKEYVDNPDPQYAVLLKGKWGCGKSFFIKNWLFDYGHLQEFEGDIVLEPIMISLYGKRSIGQITDDINRALHPILYSKGAETLRKVLDIAGKVVFRANFDVNNDKKSDLTLTSSIDSLSLFGSDNEEIKGLRFLIFDDLERCQVEKKELLGYINYFVEHCGCHVVILGDETHMPEDERKTLLEFKEKTIGREFEVLPDIDGATEYFLKAEPPLIDILLEWEEFIVSIFKLTNCNNLRILRQCLYDFKVLLQYNENLQTSENRDVFKRLIASFIVVYCEYKGGKQELLSSWKDTYGFDLLLEGSKDKSEITALRRKYDTSGIDGVDVLECDIVNAIVNYIEKGVSLSNLIKEQIDRNHKIDITPLERLASFYEMTNTDFLEQYGKLELEVQQGRVSDSYLLGRVSCIMGFFDLKKIHWMSQATICSIKRKLKWLIKNAKDKESLNSIRVRFIQGINSYMKEIEIPIVKDFVFFFQKEYDSYLEYVPDKMQLILNNLKEDNVDELISIDSMPTSDEQCLYEMCPVLYNIDVNHMFDRMAMLSNKGLLLFSNFLERHYQLRLQVSENRYSKDKPNLELLLKMVSEKTSETEFVERYVYEHLLKRLKACICRCDGEQGQLL